MGAVGTADSAGRARRATAQDRMRAAINAILYLLRTGCPWRYLPRDGFPPRSTVYNIFRKFPSRGHLGGDLGRATYGAARADGPRGQPVGCGSRQPIGQIGGKGAVKTTRWVTTPASR